VDGGDKGEHERGSEIVCYMVLFALMGVECPGNKDGAEDEEPGAYCSRPIERIDPFVEFGVRDWVGRSVVLGCWVGDRCGGGCKREYEVH